MWQTISFNDSHWQQTLYFEGDESFSLSHTDKQGLDIRDETLDGDFTVLQILNVKMSDFRQDFVLKVPAELKLQQKIDMDKKTMFVKLFDDKNGAVLFEDKIDLVEQTLFGNLPSQKEVETQPEKEEEEKVEPKDEEFKKPKNDESIDSQDEPEESVTQEEEAQEQIETESPSEPERSYDLAPYIKWFPIWAKDQHFKSGLSCHFEIDNETPFPDREGDLWAIWANHDCFNWEVILTIILDTEVSENVIANAGILLTENGCIRYQNAAGIELD